MWRYILVVFFFTLGTVVAQTSNEKIVTIAQGAVRGYLEPDGSGYAFYNIPYATAPTGTDRFKAPLPPPVWMTTFDAVDKGIICPQHIEEPNTQKQEDCLIANVLIPKDGGTNLPVAVLVHGGAYQYGLGNSQKLNALVATSKMIAVTFNYRLGAHGFLCLRTEGVPGNAGLKDQVALLRWVKNNIASFGGDPNNVALMGCSAGGGSVDILTLSKAATGLFNKAIVDSGNAIGAVGLQLQPILKAQKYAKALNFTNVDDFNALEEFYRTIPFEQLFSQVSMVITNKDSTIVFTPCLERDVGSETIFEESPMDVIEKGSYAKIPLMYGFANMEGLIRIGRFEEWREEMNENFANFIPAELHFESKEVKEKVADDVKKFYFGNEPVNESTILSFIDYFTDILYAYPMLKTLTARIESQNDTIYLQEYSFVDENSESIPHTDAKGADHCFQTAAVTDEDETNISEEYKRMKAIIREYYLNFILTGVPSSSDATLPAWLPTKADRSPYMSFGTSTELKSSILLEKRAELWDDIYKQYYRGPVVEPTPSASGSIKSSRVVIACVLLISYLSVVYVQ